MEPGLLYKLNISAYNRAAWNLKDQLIVLNNSPFTTKDRDYDPYSGNCAEMYLGAWWYTFEPQWVQLQSR